MESKKNKKVMDENHLIINSQQYYVSTFQIYFVLIFHVQGYYYFQYRKNKTGATSYTKRKKKRHFLQVQSEFINCFSFYLLNVMFQKYVSILKLFFSFYLLNAMFLKYVSILKLCLYQVRILRLLFIYPLIYYNKFSVFLCNVYNKASAIYLHH